ncbi:MAG TPA: response regulator transcription factor [Lutibacter sp.]|nr:response regulator transcription factor [Lutibacter sp.]
MIKAVLIDDESKGRKILRNTLLKYCHKVEIIGEADGVVNGKVLIDELQPELVFLDISMKDGTGFDLLALFSHFSFGVIFVTAHNEFAIKAFKCSAIDYLLKPVIPDELIQAVTKFENERELKNLSNKIASLIDNKIKIKKLALPTSTGIELIKIEEIIYCESARNYTIFNTISNKQIIVAKTIKEYDIALSDSNFFRIHQSYLVNMDYISKYNKNDGGFVILENNKKLPVSRRKKQAFVEAILS